MKNYVISYVGVARGTMGTMGLWYYGTMGSRRGTMGSRREFVKLISARSKTKSQVSGLQYCF